VETEEGARAGIDDLSMKYHGHPSIENYGGETRVIYKILPERVQCERLTGRPDGPGLLQTCSTPGVRFDATPASWFQWKW